MAGGFGTRLGNITKKDTQATFKNKFQTYFTEYYRKIRNSKL